MNVKHSTVKRLGTLFKNFAQIECDSLYLILERNQVENIKNRFECVIKGKIGGFNVKFIDKVPIYLNIVLTLCEIRYFPHIFARKYF